MSATEKLFAYGTLQLERVQLETFGRRLRGAADALVGFRLQPLPIDDPAVIEISGKAEHTMAVHTGRSSDLVPGTVFEVTSEELVKCDEYEVAAVQRVATTLRSGVGAWVYVDAGGIGDLAVVPRGSPSMFERRHLVSALRGLGVSPHHDVFPELFRAYSETGRHYHDRSHVSECLYHLERHRRLADRPHEIAVALWFHDAVYDTRRGDNEEQSAIWADRYLSQEGVERAVIGRVTDMILATKSHQATGADSTLMVDIDLGVLGAPSDAFDRYDRAIRREYAWVPDERYRVGRRAVLERFLDRERIYRTAELNALYERRARDNLTRKLLELGRDAP